MHNGPQTWSDKKNTSEWMSWDTLHHPCLSHLSDQVEVFMQGQQAGAPTSQCQPPSWHSTQWLYQEKMSDPSYLPFVSSRWRSIQALCSIPSLADELKTDLKKLKGMTLSLSMPLVKHVVLGWLTRKPSIMDGL